MSRFAPFAGVCLVLAVALFSGCAESAEEPGRQSPSATVSALPTIDTAADTAALAQVEVTAESGEAPILSFSPPFSVTGPVARVVEPGTGDVVEPNSAVAIQVVTVDGSTGEEEGNTYRTSPQLLVADEVNTPGAMLDLLVGAQVGARILLASPVSGQQTKLWVFEVISALEIPLQAAGEAVEVPAGLPLIGYADSGTVNGQMPTMVPNEGPPPAELVVQPLIVGDGEQVREDSSLVVQAAGWLWDGTQFQNSWEEGPGLPIVLSGTIQGWREGLVGQTIGSQILLVVPPELAWGEAGKGELIPSGSTLVYVIDILVGI